MVEVYPVHDAQKYRGKHENESEYRSMPRRQNQVFLFKNYRDKKKYQCARHKADGHMRYGRMERLFKSEFCQ
jgi:hypothetical protein